MSLVPWTYNNPRVDFKNQKVLTFPFCNQSIKIEQNLDAEVSRRENTNYKLWHGSYLLASYLEHKGSENFSGKKCLELGAGCGLVGMLSALLGADVTVTDLPSAIHHTRHCLALNRHLSNIANIIAAPYSWGTPANDDLFKDLDFIFGSDIVYDPDFNDKLLFTFKLLCAPKTTVLLSYKERGLGENFLFEMLKQENFSCVKELFNSPPFKDSKYELYIIKRLPI